jgi:O-6-methylguanine DNA methyltransferase
MDIKVLNIKNSKLDRDSLKDSGTGRSGKDPNIVSYDSRMFPAVGRIYVAATHQGICWISLPANSVEDFFKTVLKQYNPRIFIQNNKLFDGLYMQLEEYLAGRRAVFSIPLDFRGTSFQAEVWEALSQIPYGETRSYGEIARKIGRPKAVRAVGQANHVNPLPILIPCHRVIGAQGELVGYGGGIPLKKYFLALEKKFRCNLLSTPL